jgi:predicted pyridoxine 5'-phosphate oxidase superfamily flavin-nucleotide-binding protein
MDTSHPFSDVGFSPTVKAIQTRLGSRRAYEKMDFEHAITPDLAGFIGEQTSVFLGTVNAEGQPYIQHRGGPAGFLKVLGPTTLALADFAGNRQYITMGNLEDQPKAFLFLMDYTHRRRVKIWGEARMVEDDAALLAQLMPEGYKARGERVLLFEVKAWNVNCPQHIPQRFEAADVAEALAKRDARIAELEAEVAALRGTQASA